MIRKHITQQYSVSEQVTLEDVKTLAEAGVTLIVCNRPDNEEEGQLNFADVAAKAKALHINAVHIPFAGGQMQAEDVVLLQEALENAKNVHAYCRTGNRSNLIWEAAKAQKEEAAKMVCKPVMRDE